MIKIYGYYSCGGYKDMYLGNSDNCADCTYYLPLLPMIKNRNKAEDADKIEKLEQLSPIHIITNDKHYGFPSECNTLFSHGGYAVIYKTLSNGDTCLALKDIPSTTKDELGRDVPFNLLFIANGDENKLKLERLALYVKDNYNECIEFCCKLFTYDYVINGIKFDLPALMEKINLIQDYDINLKHINNHLIYLMLHSHKNIDIAFKEQNLNYNKVPCIVNTQGDFIRGGLLTINDRCDEDNDSIFENIVEEKVESMESFRKEIAELKAIVLKVYDELEKINRKMNENLKIK